MSLGFEITEELIARQSPEAQAIIRALLAQNAVLAKRVAELEDRLGMSPQNSSLPPSVQHSHAEPPPAKPKSNRKRGGQPGHPRHERALIPVEQCDDVIVLKPTACRRCGKSFRGRSSHRADLDPLRHQVWELPEIEPTVIEYQQHRLVCLGCGESTCGELPDGMPTSTAGPRLVALTAMLMGCFRQSKRRVAMFLEQILGQPCSAGWVVKLQNQATAALRPTKEMFRHWSRCRDGTLTRAEFVEAMQPNRREVDALLLRGEFSGNTRLVGMCRPLHDHRDWLWTFVDVAGVEPTNNASERALRHAVTWRKLSFGTQSPAGSRFVETILTIVETCRQAGPNLFGFLAEAIQAKRAHRQAPTLLPGA